MAEKYTASVSCGDLHLEASGSNPSSYRDDGYGKYDAVGLKHPYRVPLSAAFQRSSKSGSDGGLHEKNVDCDFALEQSSKGLWDKQTFAVDVIRTMCFRRRCACRESPLVNVVDLLASC